jgi:Transmembrane amino acid transporter protein
MIELHDRAPVSDRRGLLTPSVDRSSDDDDDAAVQDDQHLAGPFRTIVNTFLAFFGAAILSTPYAFASGGLLLASATLAAVSAGCVYCMWLIVVCKRMLISKGAVTYSDICGQALGLPGLIIAETALVITQVSLAYETWLQFCRVHVVCNLYSVRKDFSIMLFLCYLSYHRLH